MTTNQSDVFIRKVSQKKQLSLPVGTMMKRRATAGEIGIEVECEAENALRKSNIPVPWGYHKDGSLRGNDNAEYVLEHPIMFKEVPKVIKDLWDMFKTDGTVLSESNRTSVHVHLNVQKFHLNRLAAFSGMYFCVESILTEWCGDHRVGNLFCLRAKDAPHIVTQLKDFIRQKGVGLSDGMHYAGFNIQAMAKFGSIEIRSLRGVIDPNQILSWVNVLGRMYELSAEYPDPRTLVEMFSGEGPVNFLRHILGPEYSTIRSAIELSDAEVVALMYEGIRIAQDLCYCRDWSEFTGLDIKTDPFRRSEVGLAAKLSVLTQGGQNGGFAAAYPQAISQYTTDSATLTWGEPVYEDPVDDGDDAEFEEFIMDSYEDEE